MHAKSTMDVKKITVSALLTALTIIIPMLPIPKLVLGPFSATLASHVPGILAMFISPFTVVCTSVGAAIGFLATLGPLVALRAFSHIIFGLVGCYMLKKQWNYFIVIVVTMLLHGAGEVFVALMFGEAFMAIWKTVGCFTMIHHLLDFAISTVVYKALKSAKIIVAPVNYKNLKA
ncbi:MAG: ECF transporter S component [Ruminococcaceae bacterium]|nr:ECF transporter S component [Oscillospiraceae bacterium]